MNDFVLLRSWSAFSQGCLDSPSMTLRSIKHFIRHSIGLALNARFSGLLRYEQHSLKATKATHRWLVVQATFRPLKRELGNQRDTLPTKRRLNDGSPSSRPHKHAWAPRPKANAPDVLGRRFRVLGNLIPSPLVFGGFYGHGCCHPCPHPCLGTSTMMRCCPALSRPGSLITFPIKRFISALASHPSGHA